MKRDWENNNNPLKRMFSPIGIQPPQPQNDLFNIKTEQSVVSAHLRTDDKKYNKYNSQEKKLILSIYGVIERSLSNEKERDALIDKIENEITK